MSTLFVKVKNMSRKVAVLVGSLRQGSFTRTIAQAVAEQGAGRFDARFIEIGDLPFYNPDLDTEAPPAAWTRFRTEMAEVDAVLFATQEYNRSMPATLKNALDVGSRPYGKSIWNGKPAAIVSVSPGAIGGFGANHHLRQPLVFLNMPVMQQPEAYISRVGDFVNEQGQITQADTLSFLKSFASAFADWIELTAPRS